MCWQTPRDDRYRWRPKPFVDRELSFEPLLTGILVKYVALLALNKIVASHSHLVSLNQDVIMDCINDPDISIRLQALYLGASMVNSENLVSIVERLLQQLSNAPMSNRTADDGRSHALGVEPAADSEDENTEEVLVPIVEHHNSPAALPAEYRMTIIRQIIDICSKNTYASIVDFEWYIDVLLQLVRLVPAFNSASLDYCKQTSQEEDIAGVIGWELRNVAVRVSTARADAVMAAFSLITIYASDSPLTLTGTGGEGVLASAAWLIGEYYDTSVLSDITLGPLIHPKVRSLPPIVMCTYLQAIPKVLCAIISRRADWSSERQTMMSLLVARIIHFLEPLSDNPNVEVQERSVEFLELMRITSQAISSHDLENGFGPLLLTTAIPQLFTGYHLNPVAPTAQGKVPLSADLELDTFINKNLATLLRRADHDSSSISEAAEFESFYNQRSSDNVTNGPEIATLTSLESETTSYQQTEARLSDTDTLSLKHNQRRERNKDDPFYIGNDKVSSDISTPFHDVLRTTNGEDVDVDSIPIMNLDLGEMGTLADNPGMDARKPRRKRPRKVHIAKDENIEHDDIEVSKNQMPQKAVTEDNGLSQRVSKKSLLQVDSSGLSALSLSGSDQSTQLIECERPEFQDTEMARALAEVERLRLEMQRASERIEATDGTPAEGTFVKTKKKGKSKQQADEITGRAGQTIADPVQGPQHAEATLVVKKRRKKRKPESSHNGDQLAMDIE